MPTPYVTFLFADDIILIAPTVSGLQAILAVDMSRAKKDNLPRGTPHERYCCYFVSMYTVAYAVSRPTAYAFNNSKRCSIERSI